MRAISAFVILKVFSIWISVASGQSDLNFLGYCLKESKTSNLKECVQEQTIYFLREVEESDNFTLAVGVITGKSEKPTSRIIENLLDQDPINFRGLLENAGAVFSQRSLQWDLGNLYPGLCLRIGPSADVNSVLEFVIDPSRQVDERIYLGDDPTTARVITQRLLLPFLLGLKFNLATIIPLFFGAIILLCKKAALLAKLAIFISGIFGVGGAFSLGSIASQSQHGSFDNNFGHFRPGGVHVGGFGEQIHHHDSGYYRQDRKVANNNSPEYHHSTPTPDRFYNYEKNVLMQNRNIKLHEKDTEQFETNGVSPNQYREFTWKTI